MKTTSTHSNDDGKRVHANHLPSGGASRWFMVQAAGPWKFLMPLTSNWVSKRWIVAKLRCAAVWSSLSLHPPTNNEGTLRQDDTTLSTTNALWTYCSLWPCLCVCLPVGVVLITRNNKNAEETHILSYELLSADAYCCNAWWCRSIRSRLISVRKSFVTVLSTPPACKTTISQVHHRVDIEPRTVCTKTLASGGSMCRRSQPRW